MSQATRYTGGPGFLACRLRSEVRRPLIEPLTSADVRCVTLLKYCLAIAGCQIWEPR